MFKFKIANFYYFWRFSFCQNDQLCMHLMWMLAPLQFFLQHTSLSLFISWSYPGLKSCRWNHKLRIQYISWYIIAPSLFNHVSNDELVEILKLFSSQIQFLFMFYAFNIIDNYWHHHIHLSATEVLWLAVCAFGLLLAVIVLYAVCVCVADMLSQYSPYSAYTLPAI